MSARTELTLALCSTLLAAAAAWSQMPSQPGKLEVKSQPTGARVEIDGTVIPQTTDATLVILPGNYTVSVGASGSAPHCPSTAVTIRSNETKVLVCKGTAWSPSG
jgi:hypothetical protein